MHFNVATTVIRALGLAAAVTATGLQAAVMTKVDTAVYANSAEFTAGPFQVSDTGGNPNSAQRTASVVLDAFDSTLGMLTDVEIRFHSTYGVKSSLFAKDKFGIKNVAEGSSRATLELDAKLVDPDGGDATAVRSLRSSCHAKRYFITAACLDVDRANGIIDHVFDTVGFELDVFDAPIRIDFTAALTADLWSCDDDRGDYCKATAAGQWWGIATVTYAYTNTPIGTAEVPEPAVLTLAVAGLLGAAGARRARS